MQFPAVASVQPGDGITGHVIFTNQTGTARRVRLVLSTSGASASITSPPGPVTVPPGSPPSVPFTASFGQDSRVGVAQLQVRVVDAANPSVVYSEALLVVTVTRPPGFLAQYLPDVLGILVAIILAILAVLWRREVVRRRKDVRGLVAILRRQGEQLGAELRAPGRWSDVFRFIIRDEAEPTARLDQPLRRISEYMSRRPGPRGRWPRPAASRLTWWSAGRGRLWITTGSSWPSVTPTAPAAAGAGPSAGAAPAAGRRRQGPRRPARTHSSPFHLPRRHRWMNGCSGRYYRRVLRTSRQLRGSPPSRAVEVPSAWWHP